MYRTGNGREGPLPFLFINMAGLGPQSQRVGAPGTDRRLHQHGGHTRSRPPSPTGVGVCPAERRDVLRLRRGRQSNEKTEGVFPTG